MATAETVREALEGLRQSFVADGYDLLVEGLDDDRVSLAVTAGPEACEECLVPKPVMQNIILETLKSVPDVRRVDLRYPDEH